MFGCFETGTRTRLLLGSFALAAALLHPLTAQAQLPFSPGEELSYRVRMSPFGTVGMGTMRVEGPVDIRGTQTYVLRSDVRSTVSLVRGIDQSSSWIDPTTMRTLRFEKHERSPFARVDEVVNIFDDRSWTADSGASGLSDSAAPLDELSFIYFLRTLPLEPGASHRFDRHFDTARNPTRVQVIRHERITVGAGEFDATLIEMRVRDPRRFRGEGVIRVHISRDDCRLPLQIESSMPRMGTTTLVLESHTHTPGNLAHRSD